MEETRFGKCPCCKENRMLHFTLGSNKGDLWCGWICGKCLMEIREQKNKEDRK